MDFFHKKINVFNHSAYGFYDTSYVCFVVCNVSVKDEDVFITCSLTKSLLYEDFHVRKLMCY